MPHNQKLSSLSKKEVDNIFNSENIKYRTEKFDIIFYPKSQDFGRILVITSKKMGNSPKRNRFRRRLKSIFYEEKLFNLPYDCIVIAKRDAVNLEFDKLKDIFLTVVKNVIAKN